MKKRSLTLIAVLCVVAICLQGCSMFGLNSLLGMELSASELYYTYAGSVVEIQTEGEGGGTVGSGFFCDSEGTVITNYHVIENYAAAKIYLITGEEYAVISVKGYDIKKDIAILETECKNSVPLQFNTDGAATGAKVYTIGSSLGMTSSLSEGIVSCALRQLFDYRYIQTTAPISPGNSGGPLFDAYGNVIGINTLTFLGGQNVNLAVPIGEALNVSVSNPTSLEKLFTRTSTHLGLIHKLKNWSVSYVPEDDSPTGKDVYTILFQIRNQHDALTKTDGNAFVQIINDDDVTVYSQTLSFSKNDVVTITTRDGTFDFMYVNVPIEDIQTGDNFFGMLYFTISGQTYAFDAVPIRLLDLPVL